MGTSCSLPARKNVALPTRMVKIEQNELFMRKNTSTTSINPLLHSLTKIDSHSPTATLRSAHAEAQTAVDLDDDPKSVCGPLPTKYDADKLGIGKHFLAKEFNKEKAKKPKSKQKLDERAEVNWDRIFVQMRETITNVCVEDSFHNEIDIYLKEFAYIKPKLYNKMLSEAPPMRYRWALWKNRLYPERFYIKGLYEKFKSLSSPCENDINKDLHRTFPKESYFACKKYDNIGQQQLFTCLKALSLYFPNIGYVQGMNFLMGFLLLISGGNELDAFWGFVTLIRDHRFLMMGFFEKGFPMMDFCLYVFYTVLEEEIPLVYHHLKQQQLPDQLWVFKWFLTMFLYSVPQVQCVRIWDFVMNSGLIGLIQVAVAILKYFEKDLVELDPVGMDCFLHHLRGEDIKARKNGQSNMSNVSQTFENQSIIQNHNGGVTPNRPGHNQFNLDFENQVSICNETSEFHYNFKEVDIEEVLQIAARIPVTWTKMSHLVDSFTEATNKKLPDFYQKYLKSLDLLVLDYRKQIKFQEEVDFYIMKSELSGAPNEEIVVSNLLNDIEDINVLNDICL